MLLPGERVGLCDARHEFPSVHRCDDPVTCAILSLRDELPEEYDDEEASMADSITNIRELVKEKRFSRSRLAKEILEVIGG